MRWIILTFLLTILVTTVCIGQELASVNYSVDHGLPTSEVYFAFEDAKGYMWFGTDRGVVRFNGYEFEHYTTENGLCDNSVFSIIEDSEGRIWFRTALGCLSFFQDGGFSSIEANDELIEICKGHTTSSLHIDESGTIWIGFLDSEGIISIRNDKISLSHMEAPSGFLIREATDRQMFFGITSQSDLDRGPMHLIFESYPQIGVIKVPSIEGMINVSCVPGQDGRFYFAKDTVLMSIDGQGTELFGSPSPILYLFVKESELWVGTLGNGLFIYDLDDLSIPKQHLFKEFSISSICQDKNFGIWLTTLEKGLFHIAHPSNIAWTKTSGLGGNKVNCVIGDRNAIYVGSDRGTINILREKKIERIDLKSSSYVQALLLSQNSLAVSATQTFIIEDNRISEIDSIRGGIRDFVSWRGDLYGAHANGLIRIRDGVGEKLSYKLGMRINVMALEVDDEYLMLGCETGLFSFDGQEFIFEGYEDSLMSVSINDLEKNNDDLWIATKGNGVLIKKQSSETIDQISISHGLSNLTAKTIFVQSADSVWVGTSTGLNLIRTNELGYDVEVFTIADGLLTNDINQVFSRNDSVWVGTDQGLSVIDLKNRAPQVTVPIYLTDISVNDEGVHLGNALELEYNKNNISISYLGISYTANKAIMYRYRLKGLNDEWSYTSSRTAKYTVLPPGNYTFQVNASINGSIVSEVQSFPITISPAFWQTSWFRLAIVTGVGILIWLFFKLKVLVYNRDIVRELLLQVLRIFRKKEHLVVRVDSAVVKIDPDDILLLRSARNYVDIVTSGRTFVVRSTLHSIYSQLSSSDFVQVHRSHVVRADKVTRIQKDQLEVGAHLVPVGNKHQKEFSYLREKVLLFGE